MKWLAILIPIIAAGAVVGLGMAGIVKIPGLSPAEKKAAQSAYAKDAQKDTADAKDAKDPKAAKDPGAADSKTASNAPQTQSNPASGSKLASDPQPPAPTGAKSKPAKQAPPTSDAGAKKLAQIWSGIDAPNLIAITSDWSDADLVKVLKNMDGDKVAEFLTALATQPDPGKKPEPGKPSQGALRASKLSKALEKAISAASTPTAG